ncbi:MAG: hypothetical protein ACYS7M_00060 [Planctomycetota bacterium]|jgi:hypothetical protein
MSSRRLVITVDVAGCSPTIQADVLFVGVKSYPEPSDRRGI